MEDDVNATGKAGGCADDVVLRSRFERLQALQSAWGVIAPSRLFDEKHAIAETGRALSNSLSELANDPSGGDDAATAALDTRLDEFEREMRDVALEIPVDQLRSTLPKRVALDRRGVLDLLDLVLGAEIAGLDGTRARIPSLDYLITLLCTGGDPNAPLQDPVTLTPRLHGLCEGLDVDYDPRLPELEAEFYAAADLQQSELGEESALRTFRRRKIELGSAFFAPRILRAIMTYNTALMRRIDEQVQSSQDWGIPPSAEAPEGDGSVFETSALPDLADALRRRTAGDPPVHSPLDRIAWCLDLAYLSDPERKALLSESTGRREGLLGTTVLVGLLRRSAVVLDEEFPAVGIAPSQLESAWARELDQALQQEVNRRITADDYEGACVLTDLKSRYLANARSGARENPIRDPEPTPAAAAVVAPEVAETPRARAAEAKPKQAQGETAAQLASAALESLKKEEAPGGLRHWPWRRLARAGAVGFLVLVALAQVNTLVWKKGRVDSSELAQVSPFLTGGTRSEDGAGSAFAGTLHDVWFQLETSEQTLAADELVSALRERGMNDVMVYDGDRQLRIQALGSQPARIIPTARAIPAPASR